MTEEQRTKIVSNVIFNTVVSENTYDAIENTKEIAEEVGVTEQEVEDLILSNLDAVVTASERIWNTLGAFAQEIAKVKT